GVGRGALCGAWSGREGTAAPDSGVAVIDSSSGRLLAGPLTLPTVAGREITGIANLPTALPLQLLCYTDGTFEQLTGTGLVPLLVVPPPPPGGAVALRALNSVTFGGLVLGGSAFPVLYE